MARRASSGINPAILIGVGVFVVIVLIAVKVFMGGSILSGNDSDPFGKVTRLDVEQYKNNANSLRGNDYFVEGTINEKLRWTADRGQVISLRIEDSGDSEMIGIEIPPEFNHLNIERERRYAIKVKIRRGGIAVATEIKSM